ncbi:MAG: AAA family ATPase [Sandaracinaceae bacterium]|nr:AAA family ATPase [Sandaracinaceae bacterium]
MSGIGDWLRSAGLGKYAARFEEEEITLEVLPHLTESDLSALGLPIGPRRALLVQLARLRAGTEAASSPGASSAPPTSPPQVVQTPTPATPAAITTPTPSTPNTPTAPRAASDSGRVSLSSRAIELLSRGPERRQLSVMFCDLVGSTALAERLDAEDMHALIQTYRAVSGEIVARYGGHVAQYLGDGLMVYFGWPVAHEDAAERGVRAALEMVRAVSEIHASPRLSVRIGIATGTVVVGEAPGLEPTEARLAIGETPNLAARVQSSAQPDEIVIADGTRRLLGEAFSFTDLGPKLLKGFAAPVQLWRVDEARRTAGRFSAAHAGTELSSLVGRDAETAELARLWQAARRGERSIVAIGGEPGIGKSRLLLGLRQQIREPYEELHFQCSPFGVDSALSPFVEQLEQAAQLGRDDSPERRLDKLEALLVAQGVDAAELAPFLAGLLSLPVDRYPPIRLSPQKRKERTFDAVAALALARAKRGPLLLLVEDTHWLDPTSDELLQQLFSRLAGLPVMFVTTHRPERLPTWLGSAGVVSMSLQRLERQHGMRIVLAITRGLALPAEVMEEILARTDGVPLYVEELTKSLLESGFLRKQGETYNLRSSPENFSIPASLRDSLMARLDRLEEHKEIAQIGACFGREFSYRLIERVAPIQGAALEHALARIVEAGLAMQQGTPPAATYVFKHALVQDAAYDSLLRSRRKELHASIALALEGELTSRSVGVEALAHHYTQAGNLDAAIPLWRRAGMLALDRVALREATAHFQRGLGLVGQLAASPERDRLEVSIREPLNAAWTGLRGWAAPEVEDNARAILALTESLALAPPTGEAPSRAEADASNAESRMLAMWWMWTTTITQGRIADSLEWASRMLAEGDRTHDADLELFGHAAMMVQRLLQGDLLASREETEIVLARYDPRRAERWIQLTGHDLRTFVEVYACQLTWMLGYPDQARRASDASTEHARTVGHAFNLVWALTFSAYAYAYARDAAGLDAHLEEAQRLAEEQALAFISLVSVPQARGVGEILEGRPKQAIELLRRGIDGWTSRGGHVRVPFLKAALAEATALDGAPEQALAIVDESLAQIARPGWQEREWLAEALRIRGWILGLLGRPDEAEAELARSIAIARAQAARSWELRSATTLARLLAPHDPARAREILAPVHAWFTEGHDTADLKAARALLDELATAPAA